MEMSCSIHSIVFFFSSRRRHTRLQGDWSSDVCSSDLKPDGELRSVNYDHSILGIWRSIRMSRMMPKGYADLPYAQAIWNLPQGIDIWSQILCEFPGHYSRDQEQCPRVDLKGPRRHFEECPARVDGSFD